jgi:hypothetical protein
MPTDLRVAGLARPLARLGALGLTSAEPLAAAASMLGIRVVGFDQLMCLLQEHVW